jgi:urease accessory protein
LFSGLAVGTPVAGRPKSPCRVICPCRRRAGYDRRALLLRLLHLCDSLFPIGAFGYSDGLEAATGDVRLKPDTTVECDTAPSHVVSGFSRTDLADWLEVCLDETIGRFEGPIVVCAHRAFTNGNRAELVRLDQESIAMRPSAAMRKSSRAMGRQLMSTWAALYPDPRFVDMHSLPVAFGCVTAASAVSIRFAIEAFAYTRLAATASAAMRLMPIGQSETHRLLARTLERVPVVAEAVIARDAAPESFAPLVDIATMRHQYMHSRLFRT